MPATRSGGASRNILNGDSVNKSGAKVQNFQQRYVVKSKAPTVKKVVKKEFTPKPSKKILIENAGKETFPKKVTA